MLSFNGLAMLSFNGLAMQVATVATVGLVIRLGMRLAVREHSGRLRRGLLPAVGGGAGGAYTSARSWAGSGMSSLALSAADAPTPTYCRLSTATNSPLPIVGLAFPSQGSLGYAAAKQRGREPSKDDDWPFYSHERAFPPPGPRISVVGLAFPSLGSLGYTAAKQRGREPSKVDGDGDACHGQLGPPPETRCQWPERQTRRCSCGGGGLGIVAVWSSPSGRGLGALLQWAVEHTAIQGCAALRPNTTLHRTALTA